MKLLLIFLMLSVFACTGSLTDEQRKRMLEASEQQAIVKVTDAQITEAAFSKGRAVMMGMTSHAVTDSIARAARVKIHWLEPGAAHALEIEQQLIDAYINSVIEGTTMHDNVQKIGMDSLLYTQAVVLVRSDSSVEVKGTWNIWMSKRQLILSMAKK